MDKSRSHTLIDTSLLKGSYLLFVIFIAYSLYTVLLQPLHAAVAFKAIDDALYYSKVAHNVAVNGMWTFDGITITNGFHPLWLILCLPIHYLFPDPDFALSATYWFIFAVLILCLWLMHKVARRTGMSLSGLFVACFIVLFNLRSFTVFFSLLESHIVLLSYLLFIVHALTVGEKRFFEPKHAFIAGLLLGVGFLARLDSFLLSNAFGTLLIYKSYIHRASLRSFLRAAGSAAAGCLLFALPYLATNLLVFGHLSTVSASMKMKPGIHDSINTIVSWLHYQTIPKVQHILGLTFLPTLVVEIGLLVITLAALTWLFILLRKNGAWSRLLPIADFFLFAGMHFIFVCIMAPGDVALSAWYVVPEILALAILFGVALPDLRVKRYSVIPAAIIALVILQAMYHPHLLSRKTMTYAKLEIAAYLRDNLPHTVRGCMYDPGIIAYFSRRDFVALNGLIGDFVMAEILNADRKDVLVRKYTSTCSSSTHRMMFFPSSNDTSFTKELIGRSSLILQNRKSTLSSIGSRLKLLVRFGEFGIVEHGAPA